MGRLLASILCEVTFSMAPVSLTCSLVRQIDYRLSHDHSLGKTDFERIHYCFVALLAGATINLPDHWISYRSHPLYHPPTHTHTHTHTHSHIHTHTHTHMHTHTKPTREYTQFDYRLHNL